jgi:hypothetical protein
MVSYRLQVTGAANVRVEVGEQVCGWMGNRDTGRAYIGYVEINTIFFYPLEDQVRVVF